MERISSQSHFIIHSLENKYIDFCCFSAGRGCRFLYCLKASKVKPEEKNLSETKNIVVSHCQTASTDIL